MNHSFKVGFSFGLTSAIITTLGLMVGLYSSVGTKIAVLGGILTIALADSMSDALGVHVSEESEGKHTTKEIWISTLSTFFTKLIIALTFIVPVFLFELKTAIYVSVGWGFILLSLLSYYLTKKYETILEHVGIAALVIVLTHLLGTMIAGAF